MLMTIINNNDIQNDEESDNDGDCSLHIVFGQA